MRQHEGKLCPKIQKKLEQLKIETGGCFPQEGLSSKLIVQMLISG